MIDIDDRVFGTIYRAAIGTDPTVSVRDSYVETPPSFPCVTVQLLDNTTLARTIGSRTTERFARLSYQIDIYARGDRAKTACKKLMSAISDALIASNAERELCYPTPNADRSVYRITARFRIIADTENKTYRR